MALETLRNVTRINGEYVADITGKPEVHLADTFIMVDHDFNHLLFQIQNGPFGESGKNGCQVEDIIAVAKHIIEELNKKFPCRENAIIITKLDEAIMWSQKRTLDRLARKVEGLSKA